MYSRISDRTVIRRIFLFVIFSNRTSGLSDVVFCQWKKEIHGRSVTKQSHDYLLVIEILKRIPQFRISEFLQIAENGKKLVKLQDDPGFFLRATERFLKKGRYNLDK